MDDALRVLVVEGEDAFREGVRRILQGLRVENPEIHCSLTVECHANGEATLAAHAARPADLVLFDEKSAGGLEILQELPRRGFQGLMVMMSASASLDTALRAKRLGAFEFLAKPFAPEELRRAMRKAASHLLLVRRARSLQAEKKLARFEHLSCAECDFSTAFGERDPAELGRTRAPSAQASRLSTAAVKRLVRTHGGEISLHSREGVGTTVVLSLPTHTPTSGRIPRENSLKPLNTGDGSAPLAVHMEKP